MGGGAVTTFLLKNPSLKIAGLILSAPYLRVDIERTGMSAYDQMLVRTLKKTLGKIFVSPEIGQSHLYRREGAFETLNRDTKMFPLMTADTSCMMFEISDTTLSHEREKKLKLHAPLLVLYGKKDIVVRGESTRKFFENADVGTHGKTIHCFNDGLHEPHQDYEREEYWETMKNWMAERRRTYTRVGEQVDLCKLEVGPTILRKNNLKRNLCILAIIIVILFLFRKRIKKRLFKTAFKFIMWYNS
jgi:alpha-beta hydrolase superfamily lysophospholipase